MPVMPCGGENNRGGGKTNRICIHERRPAGTESGCAGNGGVLR